MTIAFHKVWVDQCQAAEGIKDDFGAEKALGYLIGEKLLNFLDASTTRPEWEAEIPAFVAEIRRIFQPWEITTYLETVKRVGALGHVCTDEEFETFREAKAIDESPVTGAKQILLLEQAKELLLD